MSEIKKYKKYLNFKANPRYLSRDFIVPLYTGTEPDIYEDKKTNMNDPGMVVDPSNILPKNFTDDMPFAPQQNVPGQQLELADGGSVERRGFSAGSDFKDFLNSLNKKELRNSSLSELIKKSNIEISKSNAANILANPEFKKIRPGREIGLSSNKDLINLLKGKTGMSDYVEFKNKKYYKAADGRIRELQPYTKEKIEKRREYYKSYTEEKILKQGSFPPGGTDAKKNLWYHLYRSSDATRPEGSYTRLKIDPKTNTNFWNTENARKVIFYDIENNNKKITFDNLEKYINNTFGKGHYDKLIEPYKIKNFINQQTINVKGKPVSLRGELRKRLLSPTEQLNPRAAVYEIHHPYGMTKNPFVTQLSFRDANGTEFRLKDKMLRDFKNSKTFGEKRNIFKNFLNKIDELPGSIQTAPGKKIYGENLSSETFIEELGKKSKLGRQFRPILIYFNENKDQIISNIGCPILTSKSIGGRVNFSNGSNCYAKGLEKIQSGELNQSERRIASQFLKEAGAGDELVKGMLSGSKNILKGFRELALGTGTIGTLIGTTLTVPFAAAESARGSPGGFGRELVSSLLENVNIIPGVDIDASKIAGTQVTQALERSARPGSQKMANYLFPIQEQSRKIDDLNKKLERFTYLRDNPSIESTPVSDQQVEMIQKQIDEEKLTLQNLTNNLKKNITGEDLNDVKKDITALQAEAFKKAKNIADLRISNIADPEVKKYVQENPNRIILNAENIPTFINNLANEYGESARPLIDQITKNFENIKTLGEQGKEETGILSPSGFIDVTEMYNNFLKQSEGYKTILDKQDLETKPLTEDQRINIEEMGARGGAAKGGRIGLKEGSKMGRRGFLGLIAGAAAASDLIKAIKGSGQAAKVASKIKLEPAQGMYPWFPNLVEKIKVKGKPFEEKELIMEASYKHEPKGYGGLPKGEEKLTKHVDGDTTFILREYNDGRLAVDIFSPRNQEFGDTPVTLYYRPTMKLKYYSGEKIEPAEFKVLEKEPRYFANGPDDVDIEMTETVKTPGRSTIYGDVEAAERFATGKIQNRKIIPAKQMRRDQMTNEPVDFIEETSPYGPVYD